MAGGGRIPRTVADATRFTSNTPHANTKSTSVPSSSSSSSPKPASSPASPSSSSSSSSSSAAAAKKSSSSSQSPPSHQPQQRRAQAPTGKAAQVETIEERVRRLRAAHLAAKQHDISRFDRIVGTARGFFDAAHKFTVMGLIGFSGLALFVTVYATADMMMHNRRTRNEFSAMQKKIRDDSLEAARLAYITGDATEEQIILVEEANARAKMSGVSLPSLLSAPQTPAPAGGWADPQQQQNGGAAGSAAWSADADPAAAAANETDAPPKKKGLSAWLFGGLKKEDTVAGDNSNISVARAAFENERENQKRGGPLDQVGLDAGAGGNKDQEKKGWW